MKTFEIRDQFGLDHLVLTEKPDPRPGPGQVLVQMKAFALNYRDLLVVKGLYNPKLRLPMVPLSDGAGEVAAVGEGVTRVKTGDRVAGIFMQKWLDGALTENKARSALGGGIEGVLAEYVIFSEEGLVRVPEHLTDEEAATLPCAAVTAWHALMTEGQVKAGDSVLLQGTGGVSIFALQFARLSGARIILTSSSDAKLERARQLGASEGINYKATPEWDKRVRELTEGVGVDHVVEVGGSDTLNRSLGAVRMGGSVSVIGVLSGAEPAASPTSILMNSVRVLGIYVGSRAMFERMNRAIEFHGIKPVIGRVFPWTEYKEALRYMQSQQHFGKICLKF
jgi:NADPH:quinone reductase-like Zn-dependent oxidoreductase